MTESRFWRLAYPNSTARCAEWVPGEVELEQVTCPVNEEHRGAGKRLSDLSVALPGRGVQDFVWTWYSECLIQDHVLDLFRKSGLTGFDVKPARATFKRPSEHEPPRLWELIVTGWAGMAPPESGIRLIERCVACRRQVYSAWTNPESLIDASQWDGSDFFMVWPLPNYIFVTNRVADIIRDRRLSGVALRRPADLVFPHTVIPKLSPGRLSYTMPEERARELGGALGID